MKILFLVGGLGFGGAERQVLLLRDRLAARGHETAIAAFYGGHAAYGKGKNADFSLGKNGICGWPAAWARLAGILRGMKPDILYSFLSTPNLMALLEKTIARDVKVVWGVRGSDIRAEKYGWRNRMAKWLERRLSALPDCVIANSHAARGEFSGGRHAPRRIHVIHNGVDADFFKRDPDGGRLLRRRLGISESAAVAGMAARMDPMKGHEVFLRAGALAMRERNDLALLYVGGAPGRDETILRNRAKDLGIADRFFWCGFERDMPAVYSALNLLASCSLFGEGFPNVIAEAMACGIPVAASDVGDSSIAVGDATRVVEPGDAEGMAAVWLRLLRENEENGNRLRERVIAEFSPEKMALGHEDAFLELLR